MSVATSVALLYIQRFSAICNIINNAVLLLDNAVQLLDNAVNHPINLNDFLYNVRIGYTHIM